MKDPLFARTINAIKAQGLKPLLRHAVFISSSGHDEGGPSVWYAKLLMR
jgi:hypothetical protein